MIRPLLSATALFLTATTTIAADGDMWQLAGIDEVHLGFQGVNPSRGSAKVIG